MAAAHSSSPQTPTYVQDSEIPFMPDGTSPIIDGCVERVIGIAPPFTGLQYARKTSVNFANKESPESRLRRRAFTHEAKVLSAARHHHIVPVVHSYFRQVGNSDDFVLVMQRADTNLGDHIQQGRPLDRRWFVCLANAICHIHQLGIRHRDLKPRNILLKGDTLLVADFGISQMGLGRTLPTTYEYRDLARSRQYCAPEVDVGSTRGRSADIFSMGAVFLEMLVAFCRPELRMELDVILRPSRRIASSYAKHNEQVIAWIEKQLIRDVSRGWKLALSKLCEDMLQSDRHARPAATVIRISVLAIDLGNDVAACLCEKPVSIPLELAMRDAARQGATEDVVRLIAEGVDPGSLDAIHFAAAGGHASVVKILLDAGVDVDAINTALQTALHCAARNGQESVVRLLLDRQCDVDAEDEDGRTPLQGAASHGCVTIVHLLLQHNANVQAEDQFCDTALDFAFRRRHTHVLDLLLNSGVPAATVCGA